MIVKVTSKTDIRRLPKEEWSRHYHPCCNYCDAITKSVLFENGKCYCKLDYTKEICENKATDKYHLLDTYICDKYKSRT